MPARRTAGLALIALAVVACVLLQVLTGLVMAETDRTDQQVNFPGGGVHMTVVTVEPNWPVAGPLLLAAVVGFACLVWPDRKPRAG